MKSSDITKFVGDQLSVWPMAAANFRALKSVQTRTIACASLEMTVQHNPSRIASSTADVSPQAIASRRCFLCCAHRPKEQFHLKFDGRKGRRYNIQVNPFPIFPDHLVIASEKHIPQSIWHHFVDMLDFARRYPDFTVFYNGPKSGASAPDHLHYQACPRHLMPLERAVDDFLASPGKPLGTVRDASLYHFTSYVRGVYVLKAATAKSMAKLFYRLLDCIPLYDEAEAPAVFPEAPLTPASTLGNYGTGFQNPVADGNGAPLIPASAPGFSELRGHPLTPELYGSSDPYAKPESDIPDRESEPRINLYTWFSRGEYRACVVLRTRIRSHHYYAVGSEHLTMSPGAADMAGILVAPLAGDFAKINAQMVREMMSEVTVSAEVENLINWKLTRPQPVIEVGIMSAKEIVFEIISDGAGPQRVCWQDGRINYNGVLYDELYFEAATMSTLFAEPSFILKDVTIGIDFHWERREDQKFAGALKFIVEGDKITAVNRIGAEDYLLSVISSEMKSSASLELLKAHAVISRSWLMANLRSHALYDVCADDHCQRYQGMNRVSGENVRRAVDETWGEVLRFEGKICDTRYSKCCGGRTELFSTCWSDEDYPYLRSVEDAPQPGQEPFCKLGEPHLLRQSLNDYDLESGDFFRWEASYSRDEISELAARRTGIDFGTILSLEALQRGPSGRIKYLRINGSKRSEVIGKELAIRRALSESHLKSSAFDICWNGDTLTLKGRGWGHGVGLCQTGAAVMASRGYNYRQILSHYYPGAEISNEN